MKRSPFNVAALLAVTRLALVFAGVADVWVIVLLTTAGGSGEVGTEALNGLPLWLALLLATGLTVGLHVFGTTLNDVLDVRHDRLFQPDRPIAAGRFSVAGAIVLALGALLLALVCAVPFGPTATVVCLICCGGILFFDAVGKHFPGTGPLMLGLIRAGAMFIVNPNLAFCWPIWLTMTHIVGITAAAYVLERKRPKLTGLHLGTLVGGWAFWSLVLMGWMLYQNGLSLPDAAWVWVGPVLAAGAFALLASMRLPKIGSGRAAGRALMRMGWLWLIVYGAAWMFSAGWWGRGLLVAALLPLALVVMRITQALNRRVGDSTAYRVSASRARRRSP